MEVPQSLAFSLIIFCACVVASISVPTGGFNGQNGLGRKEEISHLVTLIAKLKNIARARQHHSSSSSSSSSSSVLPAIITAPGNDLLAASSRLVTEFPDDLMIDNDEVDDIDDLDDEVLRKGYLGNSKSTAGSAKKRQGAWSYDYGLGGGRFGKRNYGDYGIGGGRFGRDVDHVDLSDASDVDVSS